MAPSDGLPHSGPWLGYVDQDDDGMDGPPSTVHEFLGSDVPRGSVPESVSYYWGDTPPFRPNLASSADLAQDTLRLYTSQENAYVAADITSAFSSDFAASVSPIPSPPSLGLSRYAPTSYRNITSSSVDVLDNIVKETDVSTPLPPPPPPPPNFPTSLGLSMYLSPSYLNINPGSVEVLDGTVKETDISTLPPPIVTWDPATLYWDPNSPGGGAPANNFSQHLDFDNWSTSAKYGSSDKSIKIRRKGKRRLLKEKILRFNLRFKPSLAPTAPSTPQPQPRPDIFERNESQKQKSEGTRNPHVADSEPLKPSETLEWAQSQFEGSKGDPEFLLDEQIHPQEDEICDQLVNPTASNRKRLASFNDVDSHENRRGRMAGMDTPESRGFTSEYEYQDVDLFKDFFPSPIPPSHRSIKSENQLRRKRHPSPTPSVESLQSLVDSIFSLASLSSASTAPRLDNAFQRVLAVLQADAVLQDLYVELTARTSAIKFKRNFGILLKRFAVDLENESSCYDEQRTAKFIRSRAKKIAQTIVDAVYPSGSTMIRGHISTSFGQTRAESSEDSGTDEEPDEYLELEKFVTNSRSFQKLHDNIRAFLGLELSKLLAELPFVDENQVVEYEESTNTGQRARSGGKTIWFMQNFYHNVRGLLLPEPPIPNGLSRVRWKCPCGETLYDDYQELKPGAAKRMEDFLRRSSYKKCAVETKSFSERISNLWTSFKGPTTFIPQWTQTLKNNGKITIVDTELRYYSDARTTRTPAHTSGEVFYLLLCHNSGVGAEVVKLRQPDICDINNDQKLFSFLREEYLALRKRWWTWISLWTLQSIKFVRFELYENELVDVKKLDDVPPPTKDHEYRHGPPNPPELNPPLGSTLLMHLFKHPELAGTKKKCLQKIPRKLRNRLAVLDENDDAIGWGLQFIEGWSKKRLMYMAALTFGFSSAVVMILVSILGHDVQNAGAIASFMLSFVTIGIATAQAAMHMN